MPKPVLSDSLFNADDVATAVLAEANLQVTNNNLGVTDITNKFTIASGISTDVNENKAFYFMGFVFLNFGLTKQSVSNNSSFTIMTINDSNYYPATRYRTNSVSFQTDLVNAIFIQTDGIIEANSVNLASNSDASFRMNINCWYRT